MPPGANAISTWAIRTVTIYRLLVRSDEIREPLSACCCRPFRECADCAFGKALCFDPESVVKSSAIVLPGYGGHKFHQRGIVQVHAKLGSVITSLA
jgi:hypothetical protein